MSATAERSTGENCRSYDYIDQYKQQKTGRDLMVSAGL